MQEQLEKKLDRILWTPMLTPGRQRRCTLELLAGSTDGRTETILLAHGFPVGPLFKLIDAGLATARAKRVMVGGRSIGVTRVRITDAGRRAIAWRASILTGKLWLAPTTACRASIVPTPNHGWIPA
jgi:hypothetical protein